MYIKKAQLDNFGKFQNKTIFFSPGLNVVYGENESGKSTLHSFLLGMLFGMEKKRGRAVREECYQRYEPWNAPSYYAGSLDFVVTGGNDTVMPEGFYGSGKEFTIERNFYHKEKRARLYSRADQEELSVEHGDLEMLFGGIGKRVYENTYCIPQAAVVTEAGFARELQQELLNAAHGGEAGIDIAKALRQLENKRRQEEQKLKNIRQKRQQRLERLEWEQELLREDIRQLLQKLTAAVDKQKRAGTWSGDGQGQARTLSGDGQRQAGTSADPGKAAASSERGIWRIPVIGRLLRLLRWIFRVITGRAAQAEGAQPENAAEDSSLEERKAAMASTLEILREQLEEKQMRLQNAQEEMTEVQGMSGEERSIQTELKSIQLAADTLARVAKESYQDSRDDIQAAVSGIFSEITGGAYDRVEVTEEGQVFLYGGGSSTDLRQSGSERRLEPWQLSRGTMEQLYFALRLGSGRCLMQEERMPVLLDETFCAYDELRLKRILQWLALQQEQTILFTSQKRELMLLEEMGIAYQRILL